MKILNLRKNFQLKENLPFKIIDTIFVKHEGVTITLEENVAKWAKVCKAKHDSSLSRMLVNELKTKMKLDLDYDRANIIFV